MGDNQNQAQNLQHNRDQDEQDDLLQGILMSIDQQKFQRIFSQSNQQQQQQQQQLQQNLQPVAQNIQPQIQQQAFQNQQHLIQQQVPVFQNQQQQMMQNPPQNQFQQNFGIVNQPHQQVQYQPNQLQNASSYIYSVPESLGFVYPQRQPLYLLGNQQQNFKYFQEEEFTETFSISQNPHAASIIYQLSNSLHVKGFHQNFPKTLEGRIYNNSSIISESSSLGSIINNQDQEIETIDKYKEFFHTLNLIHECYQFISVQQGLQTMSVASKKPKVVLSAYRDNRLPKLELLDGITSDRDGNLIKFTPLFSFTQNEILKADPKSKFAGGIDNYLNIKHNEYEQFLICFYDNENNNNHFGLIKKIDETMYFNKYMHTRQIVNNQQLQKPGQNQRFGISTITSSDLIAKHFGISNLVYGISAFQPNEKQQDQNLMHVLKYFYQDLTYEQQVKKWKSFQNFQNPSAAALSQMNKTVKKYLKSDTEKQEIEEKQSKAKTSEKNKGQKNQPKTKTSNMVTRKGRQMRKASKEDYDTE